MGLVERKSIPYSRENGYRRRRTLLGFRLYKLLLASTLGGLQVLAFVDYIELRREDDAGNPPPD